MDRRIYLTGFMGAGKTAVGRGLSKQTGWQLLDTDEMIVKKDGRTITRIFSESGEGYFRRLETMILREIREREHAIVSCGGGMVLREENVRLMKENGCIVYLKASPETILERVRHTTHRPLLEGKKTVEDISRLMEARVPRYAAAADFEVCVDGRNVEAIAEEIRRRVRNKTQTGGSMSHAF